ncbi:ribbon-helix-helix protein, CopG family [Bradyrhizobium sp. CCGUVB1N3]|uniref:ribbon-helix-helix protein, CopG family n=1 Tax=Bradyrhizobium sp. CCGUVB1N3 TaxID=2949629 RepID=UPI0020B269C8|nr:ribbon-helix-helix protein, CopG family [Bradyrhizobium sp. CCGUVB1N3]MCP3476485.1 ribbon-helix-helix protein, CopG family [Bradyrhizobium sp. CCGUVB1N3]
MKSRTGVHLSEPMTTRLTAAATRAGVTKSELIEAALDRFLESDSAAEHFAIVAGRLTELNDQIGRLGADLKMVNEVVALHARFHLAVTPSLSAAEQHMATVVGSERFEEFAAQAGRRVERGTSLMRETMNRRIRRNESRSGGDFAASEALGTTSKSSESILTASATVDGASEPNAAVREDGSIRNFPKQAHGPLQQGVQRR